METFRPRQRLKCSLMPTPFSRPARGLFFLALCLSILLPHSVAGLRDSQHIGRIVIDPKDASTVLVAALGHAYGPNAERGIFRSTDGGATWQKVLSKDENTGAIDIAPDPDNPRTVYASLWSARRP